MPARNLPPHPNTGTFEDAMAAVWKSAADAVVAGDAPTLERLLLEHPQLFRTRRPPSTWSGGLTPDYSAGDARSIIVHNHDFESWDQFAEHARARKGNTSEVAQFERAVDAIVAGDAVTLERVLRDNPDLIRARSVRRHRSTLLLSLIHI